MTYLTLIDPASAVIVLGGTTLGTILRCGVHNSFASFRGLLGALRPSFNAERAQSALAVQVQDIHRDGLLRAEPRHFGDEEFDEVTDTIIGRRSVGALLKTHRAHQDARQRRNRACVATFNQAADLAPVFGLAGTLIALSQLPTGQTGALISNSIPMAIVTTFYGLVCAHLVFAPLARFIERRAESEEVERQKLVDWLAIEVARETAWQPDPQPARRQQAAA